MGSRSTDRKCRSGGYSGDREATVRRSTLEQGTVESWRATEKWLIKARWRSEQGHGGMLEIDRKMRELETGAGARWYAGDWQKNERAGDRSRGTVESQRWTEKWLTEATWRSEQGHGGLLEIDRKMRELETEAGARWKAGDGQKNDSQKQGGDRSRDTVESWRSALKKQTTGRRKQIWKCVLKLFWSRWRSRVKQMEITGKVACIGSKREKREKAIKFKMHLLLPTGKLECWAGKSQTSWLFR